MSATDNGSIADDVPMVLVSAPGAECWPGHWRGQRSGGAGEG